MAQNGHLNGWVNHHPEPEIHLIRPNSLYLTFNAPQVDDYHRGLFLTYPPSSETPPNLSSGTLWHASYIKESEPNWDLENRIVKDLSHSKSLVLLYRISTYDEKDVKGFAKKVGDVLKSVPIGREARTKQLGKKDGNPNLDGYDCVIWTADALSALIAAGLTECKGKTGEQLMNEVRALAGPPDAKAMVGVDVGGFRVMNNERIPANLLSTT